MKMDLALNNLQWLICHKTKPNRMLDATKKQSVKSNTQETKCSLFHTERRTKAEFFRCGNAVPLLIKLEKSELVFERSGCHLFL